VTENNYIKYKRLTERGVGAGAADLGARVEIALLDERDFRHKGRLDFLDNRLDLGTATLRARAVIANPSGLFTPGLFARVRVTGSGPHQAILIADEAIGIEQSDKFIYIVGENGIVYRRNIIPGPLYEGMRVVREGVETNEWVIIRGLQRARPGDKVTPKRETATLSEVPNATPTVKMQQ
jgi:multidrug efflux pump subunit AcrA (membrane-fusion protein)